MHATGSIVTRGALALLVAGATLVGTGQVSAQLPTPTQLPMDAIKESGQAVYAAYEGWFVTPDKKKALLIGYWNRNTKQVLDIPVGPNNRIEPGGPDYGQPTHFDPRRGWGTFTIVLPDTFGEKDKMRSRGKAVMPPSFQTGRTPLHVRPGPASAAGVNVCR